MSLEGSIHDAVQESDGKGMSLEQDADDWFVRMRGPDAEAVRAQFEEWRAVPAHAEAYERRVRSFDTTMFLASTGTVRNRNLDIAKPWAQRKYAAGAVGLLLLGALVLIVAHRDWNAPQAVSRMEVASLEEAPRRIALPDGSTVILDRGSRMQISFDRHWRLLRLLAGRARFGVAHDQARLFVVEAGAGRVIAYGTLFDVELSPNVVRVALLRGAVEVRDASAEHGSRRQDLTAGQGIAIEGGSVGKPTPIVAADSQWPNDMLVLDGVEIGQAVAAFNRTAPTPVLCEVSSARSMRVTGAFRRSDSEGFARQVAATFGLGFETREDGSFAIVGGARSGR
ncbi:FecR family protein [Novosphingobium sp. PhB165]|uniref:FecR family protein n=1 Tax=Novosphingobium sp. PhB165 TaxID=2485105 RepID=UPI0010451F5F|nr:FecR domain-containing protein [Novosphingobium sp. PhB165]TCM14619.1 FecR family protein [Novosphingobium sp. PhB165]